MPEYTVTIDGHDYDVDAPNEATALKWGKYEHDRYNARVGEERERGRQQYDPTEGMGYIDKTRANIGAGMANFGQGVQQLASKVGLAKPVTDEDILEKRARDERLANSQDAGVGADWMPTAGRALQIGGEVAPTMVIPAGAAGQVGGRVGGSVLMKALTNPYVMGAAGGALSGALTPVTSDESRGANTLIGAGAGLVLPGAMSAYRGAKHYLTRGGARVEAGKRLGVNPDSPLPPHPDTMGTPNAENVPLSTAATYDDPNLAGHELASRARGKAQGDWADLDRRQREAVWENVEQGTRRSGREGEFRGIRKEMWDENTAKAMQNVKPRVWAQEMKSLRTDIDVALRSPQGQNQMRPILTEIARQMDELGPGFTPQHLAQLRSRMAGSIKGSPTDPFTSAPVSDPAFQSLKTGFDNILNRSTGNKWQRVVDGYAEDSIPVAHAKAETAVKRHFVTDEGTARTNSPEGQPVVTEAGLRRAITSTEGKNKYGTAPTFADDSGKVLKGTLEAMNRQNITQRAKLAATGGGGSMTAPLQQAINTMDPSQATNFIGGAMRVAQNFANKRALQELDQALIDPKRYYQVLQETIEAGKPLTPAQQYALHAIAVAGRSAAPRFAQPQQEAR